MGSVASPAKPAARPSTSPSTMLALVQEGYGSADCLHLREVPRPALAPGRVLVRMRAASVNALDWHTTHGGLFLEIIGRLTRQRDDPIRGVDLAGVVEAVGEGVTRFAPGDDVFGGAPATFAEYAVAREDRLLPKPRDVTFEAASTINVAGRTALQALRDQAGVQPGQRVLVYGAGGGVGTYAVQIAKALGATVTAVTRAPNVELVRSLGAEEVIDAASAGQLARRPDRYDAVIDIAATRPIGALRGLLMPDGIYVLVGAAKRGWIGVFARIAEVMIRGRLLRQRVHFFVAQQGLEDLAYLRDLVEGGTVRPAIDRTYPLDEGREAVRYLGTGEARAKVVITTEHAASR